MLQDLPTELKIIQDKRFTRITISGEADIDFVNTLSHVVTQLEERNSKQALIVDMTDVSYIDSASLGVFVRLIKIHQSTGRKIIIYKPQPMIKELFDQTGLSKMVDFCTTEDELDKLLPKAKKKRAKKLPESE
ncbi:MAG: STAS domain-containing protein [Fibrobacteres bacterium]|nr:STAS domain-containing protein [Fibrobacterota bacterium]